MLLSRSAKCSTSVLPRWIAAGFSSTAAPLPVTVGITSRSTGGPISGWPVMVCGGRRAYFLSRPIRLDSTCEPEGRQPLVRMLVTPVVVCRRDEGMTYHDHYPTEAEYRQRCLLG